LERKIIEALLIQQLKTDYSSMQRSGGSVHGGADGASSTTLEVIGINLHAHLCIFFHYDIHVE
jgi:hypothetical protein